MQMQDNELDVFNGGLNVLVIMLRSSTYEETGPWLKINNPKISGQSILSQ